MTRHGERFRGAKDGTHHALYELKVVSPCAIDDASTEELGGYVAFANTAPSLYDDILGTPATPMADRVPGAYDAPLQLGHTVQPIVLEVFGAIHPEAIKVLEGLCRKHGARLGGDELSAPWSARSFRAIHVQRLSVALQLAAAEEILDTVMLDGAAAAMATA